MKRRLHFALEHTNFTIKNNISITRYVIVLKDDKGNIVYYTDLHKYVYPSEGMHRLESTSEKRMYYIVKFLNSAFENNQINRICDLTYDQIKQFAIDYASGKLTDKYPNKQSVQECLSYVIKFLINITEDPEIKCKFTKQSLTMKHPTINRKTGKKYTEPILPFSIYYHEPDKSDERLKRKIKDIPMPVFEMILNHISNNHTDILMPFALQAFAGLRVGEAMNVRREDSPYGPGITIERYGNTIQSIIIDISSELQMRSDNKRTGKVKRERQQTLNPIFHNIFYDFYHQYLQFILHKEFEIEYGALIVDKKGKAMLKSTYVYKLKKAVQELAPQMLDSSNTQIRNYGKLLTQYSFTTHALRHWFTNQIANEYGENIAVLAQSRGDSSYESSYVYLVDKHDVRQRAKNINNLSNVLIEEMIKNEFNGS